MPMPADTAAPNAATLQIRPGGLDHPQVRALLRAHQESALRESPRESVHALPAERLAAADVSFWCAWDGEVLLGFAALRRIDAGHGELKSMRTAPASLRRGVAAALLSHLIQLARAQGYQRLSLETGTAAAFAPARALYARFGFAPCAPFAEYREDPHSTFMTLAL